jgi:hypothetical protein
VAYEALLSGQLQGYDDPVVCTYDTTRFGGPIVVDVLRTHPVAIIGGVGQENPFFAPPAEFMVGTFPTEETPEALKMYAQSQTGGIA